MPVFVVENPKGGVGKTTSVVVLACELAERADVAIMDLDPNKPIRKWFAEQDPVTKEWVKRPNMPARLQVISDVTEDNVVEQIQEAASKVPFVIVDLEGTKAKIAVLATGEADYVLVPMQGSFLDADEASEALQMIRQREQSIRKHVPNFTLPYSVVLTRTNPVIKPRSLSMILKMLKKNNINVMTTELNDREAFRGIFHYKATLDSLDPALVPNIDKAKENARSFAREVIANLKRLEIANV